MYILHKKCTVIMYVLGMEDGGGEDEDLSQHMVHEVNAVYNSWHGMQLGKETT
jgi:hypothetical protein